MKRKDIDAVRKLFVLIGQVLTCLEDHQNDDDVKFLREALDTGHKIWSDIERNNLEKEVIRNTIVKSGFNDKNFKQNVSAFSRTSAINSELLIPIFLHLLDITKREVSSFSMAKKKDSASGRLSTVLGWRVLKMRKLVASFNMD